MKVPDTQVILTSGDPHAAMGREIDARVLTWRSRVAEKTQRFFYQGPTDLCSGFGCAAISQISYKRDRPITATSRSGAVAFVDST